MEKDIRIRLIELYNQIDNITYDIQETKSTVEDLEIEIKEKSEKAIKDIDNLKRELKRDGLYSKELEEFLENYMKYYNK